MLAGLLWLSAPPAAAEEIVSVEVDPDGAHAYWTEERMKEARPMPSPSPSGSPKQASGEGSEPTTMSGHYSRSQVADPTSPPFRTHGKVFLTMAGIDYVCSGTAINSNNQSVVWTAGHCLFEPGQGPAQRWTFVPAYHDGRAPFGRWPAQRLAAPKQWRQNGNLRYDLGAAVVRRNKDGQAVGHVVGSRRIAFQRQRDQFYAAFGYPAKAPFTGNRMHRCDSRFGGSDRPPGNGPNTMWIGCDMTAGASGGGWVAGGRVLSVVSYSYCSTLPLIDLCEERLYGPYQGKRARALYRSVRGKAHFCKGERVTHLGTPGDDVIIGTPGDDVIKALGGDDAIRGRGGNDLICAGPGDDIVRGGPGRDRLHGGGGNDRLVGGPGRDFCNGGPGRDRARGCFRTKNIP